MKPRKLLEDGGSEEGVRSKVQTGLTRVLREEPTSEHVLLLLFLGVGVVMFRGSIAFSEEAAQFPRILSALTIGFAVLLLARNYLPGPIRAFVAEPYQLVGDNEVEDEFGDDADETTDDAAEADTEDDENIAGAYVYDVDDWVGPAVVALLSLGYMAAALVIGLIYSTPLFVAAYLIWAKRPWSEVVILAFAGFVLAISFDIITIRSVGDGIWTGWQAPSPWDQIRLFLVMH